MLTTVINKCINLGSCNTWNQGTILYLKILKTWNIQVSCHIIKMSSKNKMNFQLKWQFQLYDKDKSGNINEEEFVQIFLQIFDGEESENPKTEWVQNVKIMFIDWITFISREDREAVIEKAKDMFAELDDSGDGEVSQVKIKTCEHLWWIIAYLGRICGRMYERWGPSQHVVRKLIIFGVSLSIILFKLYWSHIFYNSSIIFYMLI